MSVSGARNFLSGRTAIIAGNGVLPITIAQELEKMGRILFLYFCVMKQMLCFIAMNIVSYQL